MNSHDKPLVWMHGEITTPPFSKNARIEAGYLLRQLQKRMVLSLPQSRPMPSVATSCHELRINDESLTWRIIYKIYADAILILEVFEKKTSKTPKSIIDGFVKSPISLLRYISRQCDVLYVRLIPRDLRASNLIFLLCHPIFDFLRVHHY